MLRSIFRHVLDAARSAFAATRRRPLSGAHDGGTHRSPAGAPGDGAGYAGDFSGTATVDYRPDPDGAPDPGEIVWTWVPYEEDHRRGKDRPVLIVGRKGQHLLALMLTSKDRNPAGSGGDRDYVDIGSGAWDPRGRASEVKLDRVLQIDPDAVRREGAVLGAERFEGIAHALRERYGWR